MMRFGKKGMSGESKGVVAILMIFGVIFLVAFSWTYFSQGGGPPTSPDAVIKYYDDLLKGEYGGKKYSPTSLVICLFIPLITTFSILWALIRIIPVFRQSQNRPAASVLALGLSLYVIPTMSWMIMQVFPPLIGVSAILIGVSMLLMAIFAVVSTAYQFGDLHWGGGGGGRGDFDRDHDYDSGWGGLFGSRRRDRDSGSGEEQATGVRLKEQIEKLINDFLEGLSSNKWKVIIEALQNNEDIKNFTNEQKKILFENFKEWLQYFLRQFAKARSNLRPRCGIDEKDRIELRTAIQTVEQQAADILGMLDGIKGGGYVGTPGEILSKLLEMKKGSEALGHRIWGVQIRTSESQTPTLTDDDKNAAGILANSLEGYTKMLQKYLKNINDNVHAKINQNKSLQNAEYDIVNDYKFFEKKFISGRDNLIAVTQTSQSFINSLISPEPALYGPSGIYSDFYNFIRRIEATLSMLPDDVKPSDFNQLIDMLPKIKETVFKTTQLIEKYSK